MACETLDEADPPLAGVLELEHAAASGTSAASPTAAASLAPRRVSTLDRARPGWSISTRRSFALSVVHVMSSPSLAGNRCPSVRLFYDDGDDTGPTAAVGCMSCGMGHHRCQLSVAGLLVTLAARPAEERTCRKARIPARRGRPQGRPSHALPSEPNLTIDARRVDAAIRAPRCAVTTAHPAASWSAAVRVAEVCDAVQTAGQGTTCRGTPVVAPPAGAHDPASPHPRLLAVVHRLCCGPVGPRRRAVAGHVEDRRIPRSRALGSHERAQSRQRHLPAAPRRFAAAAGYLRGSASDQGHPGRGRRLAARRPLPAAASDDHRDS